MDDEPGAYLTTDQLPEPMRSFIRRLDEYAGHAARPWFEKMGNGVFEDDYSTRGLPGPWWIYRFRRGSETAYLWEQDGKWWVRPWSDMRRSRGARIEWVASLGAALDRLTAVRRPWWRFWG